MGFLQLIPANELAATWNFLGGNLTLFAKGNAKRSTTGIKFYPKVVAGSVPCFELMGWVGPVTNEPQPYSIDQSQLHSQIPFVRIITANYPEGKLVPVESIYPERDSVTENGSEINEKVDATMIKIPETAQLSVTEIHAVYKRPFQIETSARTNLMGSVNITTDPNYLTLRSASIFNNNITWTFDPIRPGQTEAKLYISGGIAQFVAERTYRILISPGINASPKGPINSKQQSLQTTNGSTDANGDSSNIVILYPWETRVATAIAKVKEQYPKAELYSVSNSTENPDGVEFLEFLNKMVVVCRNDKDNITIKSPGWNIWGPPIEGARIIGNLNVQWPVPITAEAAFAQARKQGHTQNVKAVYLTAPLGPFPYMPVYTFIFADGGSVQISASDISKA